MSKKAIDELHMSNKCLVCGEQIDINTDLTNMNYSKQERDIIYKKLINERKKQKEEKKLLGKKRDIIDKLTQPETKKIKI